MPFVLLWRYSLSAKPFNEKVESEPLSNNALVGILVCPLLMYNIYVQLAGMLYSFNLQTD